eukprot:2889367-Amphidinium_carterae.1
MVSGGFERLGGGGRADHIPSALASVLACDAVGAAIDAQSLICEKSTVLHLDEALGKASSP